MHDAMQKMPNVDFPRDGNAGTNGVYWYPSTMDPRTYTRSYARTGHWDNISRPNFHLITGSKVTRILFEGDVASGVTFVSVNGTQITTVKAKKEVILAAGTIHTPHILQLGGIGPAALLKQAGVPVKVDLPGVGSNFQDHGYTPGVSFRCKSSTGLDLSTVDIDLGTKQPPIPVTSSGGDPATMLTRNLGAFLGLPAISPNDVDTIASKYENQDLAAYIPKDTHPEISAGYQAQRSAFTKILRSKNVSILWQILSSSPRTDPVFQHPVSRGTININPSNPTAEPIIDYRAFTNPLDIEIMVLLVRFVRRFFTSETFAPYGPVETSPGAAVASDDQLKAWIRQNYVPSVYHPVGTAALMRRELGGVVGEDLLVYGVRGLSVVDASVIPIIPGCPTTFTVYAIAEKVSRRSQSFRMDFNADHVRPRI